ncbi:hypothetical protein VNO80_28115 [Phaseolus coccineus]|uniref:Uncharacterized protein n=1 Tax=Phaseolus coccineus TaxID=3886 RepID=A0AAN9LHG9_PHACN
MSREGCASSSMVYCLRRRESCRNFKFLVLHSASLYPETMLYFSCLLAYFMYYLTISKFCYRFHITKD